jgi:hypothetical protein
MTMVLAVVGPDVVPTAAAPHVVILDRLICNVIEGVAGTIYVRPSPT